MNASAVITTARLLLGATTVVCALFAGSAAALADETQTTVSRNARVSLTDLDLSTPEGMQAARERVRATARRSCLQLSDPDDLFALWTFQACVDRAVTAALRQVTRPTTLQQAAGHGIDVPGQVAAK